MKKLREHIITKYFWMLLALHILNVSIDSPDFQPQMNENLIYNDIESIVELVLENCFDIENAIEEYDESDDPNQIVKFEKKIELYFEDFSFTSFTPIPHSILIQIPHQILFFINNVTEEPFQPPEYKSLT